MAAQPRIALLGLGAMGSRVAAHLLAAGYPLQVYNRDPAAAKDLLARGATWAPTPRAAAEHSDVVIAYLRDDEASREVWLDDTHGAVKGLSAHSLAIESSTLSPAWVRELAGVIEKQGARFLDAMVSGSRPQAENKQLISLVGGDAAAVELARPVLSVYSSKIFHVGGTGAGATLKLGVNAFMASQVAAVSELFALMGSQGIAATTVLPILTELPMTSDYIKVAAKLIVEQKTEPLFPLELASKDLRYAGELAENSALDLSVLAAVREVFAQGEAAGIGGQNLTAIAEIVGKVAAKPR